MTQIYLQAGISKQGHQQAMARSAQQQSKASAYVGLMYTIREMHPGMGLRAMYEQFCPSGIGRDAFIALGLSEGFRLRRVMNPGQTTRSSKSAPYANLLTGKWFTAVNQLWSSDLFYFSIAGQHYYVVLIMDVYSRRIIGYAAADNMRAENNIQALTMALHLRGQAHYQQGLIHHSDRGAQYVSDDYTSLLQDHGICISMCSDVLENAHIERANGTIKNDYLARWPIRSGKALPHWVAKAVHNYNHRSHQSLQKMTPIEFETYVKQLPKEQRPRLQIFTLNQQISENPNQLMLF